VGDASDRGWGPGWPTGAGDSIDTTFEAGGTRFPSGVRHELAELVERLVLECKNRGYRFGNDGDPSYGCWGYQNRPISGTNTPSNHSWGLAVDINAPSNPNKEPPIVTDMPDWMPQLWEAYGFRWGGTYTRPDAMHYEFMGTPQQAAQFTAIARDVNLGDTTTTPTPTPNGRRKMYQYIQDEHDHLYATDKLHCRWLVSEWDDANYRDQLDDLNLPTVPLKVKRQSIINGEFGVIIGTVPPW
jgi:hypothetical protein